MSRASTSTAPASAELLPGYHVEPDTGAWLSLTWPPPFDPLGPLTIGPQIAKWCEDWLHNHLTGEPWRFTRGQFRFLVYWYALRGPGPDIHWLYRSGVKRGAKGTGKDPLLGVMAIAELCGPTRPAWLGDRWVGEPHRMALVQIAANSEAQAKDPLRIAWNAYASFGAIAGDDTTSNPAIRPMTPLRITPFRCGSLSRRRV